MKNDSVLERVRDAWPELAIPAVVLKKCEQGQVFYVRLDDSSKSVDLDLAGFSDLVICIEIPLSELSKLISTKTFPASRG